MTSYDIPTSPFFFFNTFQLTTIQPNLTSSLSDTFSWYLIQALTVERGTFYKEGWDKHWVVKNYKYLELCYIKKCLPFRKISGSPTMKHFNCTVLTWNPVDRTLEPKSSFTPRWRRPFNPLYFISSCKIRVQLCEVLQHVPGTAVIVVADKVNCL